MKPSMVKAGIFTAVTAAAFSTVAGLIPATALASPGLPEMPQRLAGKTIFLDPGHQGPNHNQDVAKQVDDGRGGTKACQTTGMTSLHGIPEHTINWDVAQLVRTSLEGLGARVVMSRPDDIGWGGCVDERARAANQSGADIAVSIHADSAAADARGFHVIVPQLPVPDAKANEVQSVAGLAASKAMRDAYVQAGFPVAAYNGAVEGLQPRADIAGPALTQVPDVFLEMGNGANAEDAALLETQEGQLRHAVTITTGVVSYLLGLAIPPSDASQAGGPAVAPPAQPAQFQVPPAGGADSQALPGVAPQAVPQGGGANPPQGGSVPDQKLPPGGAPVEPQAFPQGSAPVEPQSLPQGGASVAPQSVPQGGVPVAPQAFPQGSAPVEPQSLPQGGAPAEPQSLPQGGSQPAPGALPQGGSAPVEPKAVPQGGPAQSELPGAQASQPQVEVRPETAPQLQPGAVPELLLPQVATPGQPLQAGKPQSALIPEVPQPVAPGAAPVAQPIAAPVNPQAPATPGAAAPQLPGVGTQSNPGVRTPPGSQANPGAQTNPGAQAPSTDKNSKSGEVLDIESMSSLVQTALKMMGPLAKMLMGQNGVASDLVNLAYSLVSVLSSSMLTTPTK